MASWADKVEAEKAGAQAGEQPTAEVKPIIKVEEDEPSPTVDDVANELARTEVDPQNEPDVEEEQDLSYLNKYLRLEDGQDEVVVQQADPNSPIYSAKKFDDLNLSAGLLQGIYEAGFKQPSKIQEKALPLLLSGENNNLIAQSQSGTGKTTCFVVGMLARCDPSVEVPQALCLSPTRELAVQNHAVLEMLGKYTNTKAAVLVKETYNLKTRTPEKSQALVGTPGTVIKAIQIKRVNPKGIKVFVLDEADQMLDKQGMLDDSLRIKKLLPNGVQCLLFSATFKQVIWNFALSVVPNPNQLRLRPSEVALPLIKQCFIRCPSQNAKYEVVKSIYEGITVGKTIIFVLSRKDADNLKRALSEDGHAVSALHGAVSGPDRDRMMDDFREGRSRVLIATNVLARGIDVMEVNLVINYDLPYEAKSRRVDKEAYIHRIGRTGRFGRKGVAINLVHDDKSMQDLQAIQKEYNCEISELRAADLYEQFKKINSLLKKSVALPSGKAEEGGGEL